MELDEMPAAIARNLTRTASTARGAGRSAARMAQEAVPHADTPEVESIRSDPAFLAEVDELAAEHGRTPQDVLAEATEGLREMAARHRINRATPVTPTAAVCVTLLAADRALTLDETVATVHPLARHLEERGWAMAGGADLTDRGTVRRALGELDASGVLVGYSGGRDTVWGIAPERHLVASVYRNSAVHALLARGVVELALQAVATDDAAGTLAQEALRLRELLKFDFFFADRDGFTAEVAAEVGRLAAPDGSPVDDVTPAEAAQILRRTDLRVAHLTLRPFLEAYAVVADELAAAEPGPAVVEKEFLPWCLRVARQQAMQRRLASWESVSSEMLSTALRLARHRGLLDAAGGGEHGEGAGDEDQVARERRGFADEIRAVRTHLARLSVDDDGPALVDLGEAR